MKEPASVAGLVVCPSGAPTTTSAHINYRPDIDGLRGVAVLGVILYHAFPGVLPGGFIGVDIFFVISGYLISGILYKGLRESGFSFYEFYARRIRRLFPSLITLQLLVLLSGNLLLFNDEYELLGKHLAAGALFIQNFSFWNESGYFDVQATLKPILHLWSLAVEEQFYIFFPPLLLLFSARKWRVPVLLWLMLIASFAANVFMSHHDREADFFLTPYRAWEFLGGALLAWWHYGSGHPENILYGDALAVVGAIFLGAGMAFIPSGGAYPGWGALMPVIGSILLIAAGRESWVNRRILAHPSIVWVGLISYPLYLFHWPPLSFVHIVKGSAPDVSYRFSALGVGFALTVATYYLVEKPLRFSKSRWTVPVLVALFFLTGILGALVWQGVIPSSKALTDVKMAKVLNAMKDRRWGKGLTRIWRNGTLKLAKVGGDGPCTLFFGDSNTEQYSPRIVEVLKGNKGDSRGAMFLACGGVPPLPDIRNDERPHCEELVPKLWEVLASHPEVDRVVIAALWTFYFSPDSKYLFHGESLGKKSVRDASLQAFGGMLRDLVAKGKEVTVVLNIPVGRELEPQRIYRRHFLAASEDRNLVLTRKQFLDENGGLIKMVEDTARRNGASVIDPVDALTEKGVCIRENGDGPIHFDFGHLRSSYVREHVKYLDTTVEP